MDVTFHEYQYGRGARPAKAAPPSDQDRIGELMRRTLLLAAIFSAPFAAAAAAALPIRAVPLGTIPTTMRCLLASRFVAERAKDPKQRMAAQELVYFFMGRVDPGMPGQQVKSALSEESRALKGTNAGPLMNACVREFQSMSRTLDAATQQLRQGK